MSDPHYANVSLLLPMNGVNNGTSFPDYSPVPKTVSLSGSPVTSITQSKYYGSSGLFNGSDRLTLPQLLPSSGDFCIEAWIRASGGDGTTRTLFSQREQNINNNAGRFTFGIRNTTNALLVFVGGATSLVLDATTVISVGTWFHSAVSRQGDVWRVFTNGTLDGTATNAQALENQPSFIGQGSFAAGSEGYFLGNVQDFRVTVGSARYTENFTPPARLIGEISGAVTDDAGQPAVRKIVAFPRVYPQRVVTTDSAADGTYTLQAPATEHSRIVLDDAGGTLYNDIIDRVIPG